MVKTRRSRVHKNKKTKKRKHTLFNTRNEPCSKDKMSVCCPHMTQDKTGRYAATTKKRTLC